MCAITGFVRLGYPGERSSHFNNNILQLLRRSEARGRDGFGYGAMVSPHFAPGKRPETHLLQYRSKQYVPDLYGNLPLYPAEDHLQDAINRGVYFLANHRAEPTTEYCPNKRREDQQPYQFGSWVAVHNGTIANDRELKERHADWQPPTRVDSWVIPATVTAYGPRTALVKVLKGSMAVALLNILSDKFLLYRNYQPLYLFWSARWKAHVFSSFPDAPNSMEPSTDWRQLDFPPYSLAQEFKHNGEFSLEIFPRNNRSRALVICSGGLDSTTVATQACQENEVVYIVHCLYGCKAQAQEVRSIQKISARLQEMFPHVRVEVRFLKMDWLKELGGSSLTEPGGKITRGDAGAEFAHEWVPARNTAMIGMVASMADRFNCGRIYLGLNLEESGAYPDNTVEFYQLFSKVLDVGTQARPEILNPMAELTKKEIVQTALKIGAPIEHSWSCYEGGELHCGVCGPCVMRRTAFEMLHQPDSVQYAQEVEH